MLRECDTSASDVDLYLEATPPYRYVPGQYLNYDNRVLPSTLTFIIRRPAIQIFMA